MRSRALALLVTGLAVCGWPERAHAQITDEPTAQTLFPDPAKFARGFFAEAEMGGQMLYGRAAGKVGPGVAVGGRFGYDVFRWLGLQAHLFGATHRADLPSSPQDDELLQLYQATAELRLAVRLRQLGLFAFGGGGVAYFSNNLLKSVGVASRQTSWAAGGGGGFDWHTLSRHFSVGLAGQFMQLLTVRSAALGVTTYLRYTF